MNAITTFTRKHLHCCLNELSGKRNSRDLDAIDQMGYLAHAIVGRSVSCTNLAAGTPEEEEACVARNCEQFDLLHACLEVARMTSPDQDLRWI